MLVTDGAAVPILKGSIVGVGPAQTSAIAINNLEFPHLLQPRRALPESGLDMAKWLLLYYDFECNTKSNLTLVR